MSGHPSRLRGSLRTAVLIVSLSLLACCSADPPASESPVVDVGGFRTTASPELRDRPWGEVPPPPAMEKAEPPSAADVAMIRDMIPHHRQALRMSRLLLAHGSLDGRVQGAATYIRDDQQTEIEIMESWLAAWDGEIPAADPDHDHSTMPGMLPAHAVEALADLEPIAAEVEYLRLMVAHHRGAVQMSQTYLADGVNSYALSTARHVIREQQQEIVFLERLRADLCAGADPGGCAS